MAEATLTIPAQPPGQVNPKPEATSTRSSSAQNGANWAPIPDLEVNVANDGGWTEASLKITLDVTGITNNNGADTEAQVLINGTPIAALKGTGSTSITVTGNRDVVLGTPSITARWRSLGGTSTLGGASINVIAIDWGSGP